MQNRKKTFAPFDLPIVPHTTHDFDIHQLSRRGKWCHRTRSTTRLPAQKFPLMHEGLHGCEQISGYKKYSAQDCYQHSLGIWYLCDIAATETSEITMISKGLPKEQSIYPENAWTPMISTLNPLCPWAKCWANLRRTFWQVFAVGYLMVFLLYSNTTNAELLAYRYSQLYVSNQPWIIMCLLNSPIISKFQVLPPWEALVCTKHHALSVFHWQDFVCYPCEIMAQACCLGQVERTMREWVSWNRGGETWEMWEMWETCCVTAACPHRGAQGLGDLGVLCLRIM